MRRSLRPAARWQRRADLALPSKRAASGAIVRSAEVEDEMIYVVSGEVEATIGSAASRAAAGAVLIRSRDATRVGERRTSRRLHLGDRDRPVGVIGFPDLRWIATWRPFFRLS